jgi:hypothetical protein
MRPLAMPVNAILSAIIRHTPVEVEDAYRDGSGDWFHLSSEDLEDYEVYHRLSNNWTSISGANRPQFSLIHFLSGQGGGVWLLHRKAGAPSQYPVGCQQVHS